MQKLSELLIVLPADFWALDFHAGANLSAKLTLNNLF